MTSDNKKSDLENYIFFLGGHDAEMDEIYKLLQENGIPKEKIHYKELQWGAELSAYKEELTQVSDEQIAVLIELNIDDENLLTKKYKPIDHHNKKAGANVPTSLEQVAELLRIELNRRQQLISANDKDMFKGMQNINATGEEIKKINELENEAQKITSQDYELAEKSINHYARVIDGDIIIINSLTRKTRAILEKLYDFDDQRFKYSHIFIRYNEDEINYTGNGEVINNLIRKYRHLQETKKNISFWFGGYLPCRGYFGSGETLSDEEIKEIVKRPIQSHHIFLFPFLIKDRPDVKEANQKSKKEKNDNEKNIYNFVLNKLRNKNISGWQEVKFGFSGEVVELDPIDNSPVYDEQETWKYNEYNYFHENVRKTLFNTEIEKTHGKSPTDTEDKVGISYFFQKKAKQNAEFIISIKDDCKIYDYHLNIDDISLRIFENGIGILGITLYNYFYSDVNDILKINDFGRRIYPQFIGKKGTVDTQKAFLPFKIAFINGDEKYEDNFDTQKFFKLSSPNIQCAEYIHRLLDPIKEFIPIIDDRMYTICWYGNNDVINQLKEKKEIDKNKFEYNYESTENWYKYIFIDGKEPGIANQKMMKKLIANCTYSRFIDWGTLYGITRYSFVCITSRNDFTYPLIRNHMQKMYYQMCVLLLVQRASILLFNNELERIILIEDKSLKEKKNTRREKAQEEPDTLNDLEKLNVRIMNFQNRMMFDEVTPQEQGIELYDIALKNMNIPSMHENLKEKIVQAHSYVDLKTERNLSKTVAVLSSLGAIFLPATFIAAIWAMEFYLEKYLYNPKTAAFKYAQPLFIWLRDNSYLLALLELVFTILLVSALTSNLMKLRDKFTQKKLSHILISLPKLLSESLGSFWTVFWIILLILTIVFHIAAFLTR